MTSSKIWREPGNIESEKLFAVPSGKGERSILCHVGSKDVGLLKGCMLLFRGSKSSKSSDYHTEMNWNVFSHWSESKVFPSVKKIGRKSVLVLDRATYHTVLDENDKRQVQAWNKKRLVDSILRWKGVPDNWPLNWAHQKSKSQLLEQAKKIYPAPKYKIQKIADKFQEGDFSIKILFLPVAHPELNPIEMVWGCVKRAVAAQNLSFKLRDVE